MTLETDSSFPPLDLGPGTSKDSYELQDVSESPTRRPPCRTRHFHYEDALLDEAERIELKFVPDQDLQPQESLLCSSEEEQTVIRKFDRHLVLFIAFLYMSSFLDRSST